MPTPKIATPIARKSARRSQESLYLLITVDYESKPRNPTVPAPTVKATTKKPLIPTKRQATSSVALSLPVSSTTEEPISVLALPSSISKVDAALTKKLWKEKFEEHFKLAYYKSDHGENRLLMFANNYY